VPCAPAFILATVAVGVSRWAITLDAHCRCEGAITYSALSVGQRFGATLATSNLAAFLRAEAALLARKLLATALIAAGDPIRQAAIVGAGGESCLLAAVQAT
jgi:hypothetical protein